MSEPLRMNWNPPIPYQEAPLEFNQANARRELASLYHQALKEAGEGDCDDCGKHGYRVHYGRVKVCDDCARHRWKVAEAA